MNVLNYKGQELPYRISYYALKYFEEQTGKIFESLENPSPAELEVLMYYAMKAGHLSEGKPFEMQQADVELVLDECYREILEAAAKGFSEGPKKKSLLGRLFQ